MSDLISREAAIKMVLWGGCTAAALGNVVALPVIDAEPVRHGKWKSMGDCGVTECSACEWNTEEYVGDYKYCPNCGAKMDLEDDQP